MKKEGIMIKKTVSASNNLLKLISISIYLLCFVALLIFPTATSIAHEDHEHGILCQNEKTDDCQVCALLHKSITQDKYSCLLVSSILSSDIYINSQEMANVDSISSIKHTPADLKVKQNN